MADPSCATDTRGIMSGTGSGYTSGYLTPARSSSPGSGSFHTANPIDSERSSLTGQESVDEGEDWARQRREDLSSVEIPSLQHTPYKSQLRGHPSKPAEDEEEESDTDVTLRNQPSPPLEASGVGAAGGAERNWLHQPKLDLADSETVPPCPQKRPLHEELETPRETRAREKTPLLPASPASQPQRSHDNGCCVTL